MPAALIQYELEVRVASTVAVPNPTTNAFVLSSVPSATAPYIASPPMGDGQEVDPITGSVRTGSYTVEVVDATTGTDGTGTIRYLTSRLEDAQFRQQLLSRRAVVKVKTDGGTASVLYSGYIVAVRLISAARYAISIGDTRRVEQTQTIFQGAALGAYNTRGTITGGPVTADFGPVKARGGWKYRVNKLSGNDVQLTFVEGYGVGVDAPIVKDWSKVGRPLIADTVANYRTVNPYALLGGSSEFVTAYTTTAYDFATGDWAIVGGIQPLIGTSPTNAAAVRALLVSNSTVDVTQMLGVNPLFLYWPSCPHATGDFVYVSLTTVEPTEAAPLYLDAHPVDIVTAIWTNARIQYDPAGAWINAMRSLIGANKRLACRFIAAPIIAEFLEKAIFGPFGVSVRTTLAGNQELFPTRIRTDVVPSITLTAASLRDQDALVFDLDDATAVSAIELTQTVFNQAVYQESKASTAGTTAQQGQSAPLDGIMVSTISQTAQYQDEALTVFTGRSVAYTVPGMIHTATDWAPNTTLELQGIAVSMFDRYGRGSSVTDASVLADTAPAALQIGDEVYYEGPSYPNKGYRIGESTVGARIMQVVRRTETPAGPVLKLADSGLAAQPATSPAITIAKYTGAPTTTAAYTITNAATINAGGLISVTVQFTTGASSPTTGGSVHTQYVPGEVPTAAVLLPSRTTAGETVWVRARSEQAGKRPSAWTSWVGVTLDAIATITGATIGTITQTSAAVSWTNTSSVLPVVVFAYQGSSAPANWAPYRVASLPAGSTSTIVRSLTGPSIAWALGLAYESAGTLGPVTTATLTTNSTVGTSGRPAALQLIAGIDDVTLTQGVALAMWAADQTFDIVIERSTTTGSGFAEIARVSGSTPTYVDERPRDGVTYFYRIAHALGGFGLSPYTQEVSALARGVPRDVVRPDAVSPVVVVSATESGATATVTLTITDPQGRVEQVRFRERTNGGSWSAWTVDTSVPYSYSATIPTTGFVDIEYEVTGFDAAGTASQVLAGGIESFDANTIANIVSAVGTFALTGVLTIAVQADTDTSSFRYAIATTPWASDAAAYTAAQAGTLVNARNGIITLSGPYAAGTTVYAALAAYTGASGAGTVSGPYRYAFTNGSRDTVPLTARARVLTTTDTVMTVRYAVACPVAPSPNSVTLTYSVVGLATPTQVGGAALPGTITVTPQLADSPTETAGSYYDFEIARPSTSQPAGRITFTAAATSRVSDTDSVDVQSQTLVPPSLNVVTTPGATTYSIVVTYVGTMTYQINGGTAINGTGSPQTITATRPAAGSASDVYDFKVTNAGVTTTGSATVLALEPKPPRITAFSITFDYVNNYIEYNYTLTSLPTSYAIVTFAVLNGVATSVLVQVSTSATQTVVVSPVPLDASGTITNEWQLWFEITQFPTILATAASVFANTYEP